MQTVDGNTIVRLVGLEADQTDITRFQVRYSSNKKVKRTAMKDEAKNELWKNLGFYDCRKLVEQEQIGEGSFGCIYKALYDKKKAVMKIPQIAKKQGGGNNRGGVAFREKNVSSKELADDLLYEATMLLKAESNGVLKLVAIDMERNPPCMITEYFATRL